MNISVKNTVMFCPSFFNYGEIIKNEMERLGINVHLYDERPFNSILGKAILRFNMAWLLVDYIERYFLTLLAPVINDVDCIVFINPESVSADIIKKIRLLNGNVKITVYMWDSFLNKPKARELIDCVDVFFTFDPVDAKHYNLKFLPLFYSSEFAQVRGPKLLRYSLSFIGTAHSGRYKIVKEIFGCKNDVFLFLFTPSRAVFLYKKYICRELKGLSYDDVSSTPMQRDSVIDVIANSNVIVDINHPGQVGLTMRTIEVLGAGRKLITTNPYVAEYDFYNKNNILIYDGANNCSIDEFLEKPYIELDDDIYSKYSLASWVLALFGCNNK